MVIPTKWDISNNDGRHPLGLLLRVCTFESRVPLLSNPCDMPVAWDLVSRYYVAGGGGGSGSGGVVISGRQRRHSGGRNGCNNSRRRWWWRRKISATTT